MVSPASEPAAPTAPDPSTLASSSGPAAPRVNGSGPRWRLPDSIGRALWLAWPAVLMALAARLFLLDAAPLGWFHDDTRSLIEPGQLLRDRAAFPLGGKKTFLAMALYAAPILAGQPLLIWTAWFQHALGLLLPVSMAFLAAAWFGRGTFWAAPLAVLIAVHPVLLWFEHLALPDSIYLTALLLFVAAAAFYLESPRTIRLAPLLGLFVILAGTRPEANLFAPFLMLVLVQAHRADLRRLWRTGAVVVAVVIATFLLSKTSQSGLLLYTSIIHWSPDRLVLAPGVAETVRPLRDRLAQDWAVVPSDYVRARRDMTQRLEALLTAQTGHAPRPAAVDSLAKRAAVETLLRNLPHIPGLVWKKLEAMSRRAPSLGFDHRTLLDDQLGVLFESDGAPRKPLKFAHEAFGRTFESREAAATFLETRLAPMQGLEAWHGAWSNVWLAWRLPPTGAGLPGMPILWVVAAAGLLVHALTRPWGALAQLWLLAFVPVAAAVLLASNQDPRYRLFLEPFWLLGLVACLDLALEAVTRFVRLTPALTPPSPTSAP